MSKNALIVAGPNGSGKTTFVTEYLRESEISEYISADAIAERLVSRPEEMDSVKIQAGRLFIKEIHELIEAETDFIVEVTLAGKGFARTVSQLKRAGYTVTIVFIFLKSPETSVARVRNRVQAGGHQYQRKMSCVASIEASITFGILIENWWINGICTTILRNTFRQLPLVNTIRSR